MFRDLVKLSKCTGHRRVVEVKTLLEETAAKGVVPLEVSAAAA